MTNKQSFIDKMKARLDQWDTEIKNLEAKADSLKMEFNEEYKEQIEDLKKLRDETNLKIQKLQNNSGEAWKELKDGIENSTRTLGDSIRNAFEKLK